MADDLSKANYTKLICFLLFDDVLRDTDELFRKIPKTDKATPMALRADLHRISHILASKLGIRI